MLACATSALHTHARKSMITQKEWVEGCYAYYAENHYEINNPEDGEWHDAHYPVPECKYGTETIPLLKQHHAIQGVLQSEEYQHPCVWGWEEPYLQGEVLVLYRKWKSEQGRLGATAYLATTTPEQRSAITRKAHAARTPEQRSAIARKANAALTSEQRSARTSKANAARTPEQRSAAACKANAAHTPEQRSAAARKRHANATPEQRSAIARKANAARTPEERSAITRKGNATRARNRAAIRNEL